MAIDFSKSEFFRFLNVVAFFDKNASKIGERIDGIEILDLNLIKEINPSIIIIAVSSNLLSDVVNYLDGIGLINVEIIIL
jgi:NADH/NAD ratio-sensing transcriptional regulator Rex